MWQQGAALGITRTGQPKPALSGNPDDCHLLSDFLRLAKPMTAFLNTTRKFAIDRKVTEHACII